MSHVAAQLHATPTRAVWCALLDLVPMLIGLALAIPCCARFLSSSGKLLLELNQPDVAAEILLVMQAQDDEVVEVRTPIRLCVSTVGVYGCSLKGSPVRHNSRPPRDSHSDHSISEDLMYSPIEMRKRIWSRRWVQMTQQRSRSRKRFRRPSTRQITACCTHRVLFSTHVHFCALTGASVLGVVVFVVVLWVPTGRSGTFSGWHITSCRSTRRLKPSTTPGCSTSRRCASKRAS